MKRFYRAKLRIEMAKYSKIIVEHFENPRNIGEIINPDILVKVGNPVCGDTAIIYIDIKEENIVRAKFKTYGCSASISTTSILVEKIIGMGADDLEQIKKDAIICWVGGLTPSQLHCADLAMNILFTIVKKWRIFLA